MLEEPCNSTIRNCEANRRIKWHKGKYHAIVGLQCEVSEITKECKREIDNTKEMVEMSLATYESTTSNIQEELKRRPKVLNIPPLKTASNLVVGELKKSLKEKETFIEILKAEFEKIVIEEHEKHKSEIE